MRTCTIEKNKTQCNCSYPCTIKGICCECIKKHRQNNELPACYFNDAYEATYDRSISNYVRMINQK